jgi:hypothetical protein
MENHYHTILRTRPDIVATWSDWEVATRWLILFPRSSEAKNPPTNIQISALANDPNRIAQLRKRLSSLSWFMSCLNEFIARAANKEDDVKGRYWESRFKCQALLDEAAIVACMAYVDLNPIRAGLAATPEESHCTSIRERLLTWHRETLAHVAAPIEDNQKTDITPSIHMADSQSPWLCPIQSEPQRRGLLQMTATDYFQLVDKSGRLLRSGKRGAIDADLAPILLRIGLKPRAWVDTVSSFESKFKLGVQVSPSRFSRFPTRFPSPAGNEREDENLVAILQLSSHSLEEIDGLAVDHDPYIGQNRAALRVEKVRRYLFSPPLFYVHH